MAEFEVRFVPGGTVRCKPVPPGIFPELVEVAPGVWRKPPSWDPLAAAVALWDELPDLPEPSAPRPSVLPVVVAAAMVLIVFLAGLPVFLLALVWVGLAVAVLPMVVSGASDLGKGRSCAPFGGVEKSLASSTPSG